ncbi:CDP-alcohol phosphatidyltransferase [Taibaiella sp. KBW10]|uniref:CDP-alcohol phosphatidyltransferase family protein n=1 Tax=Taibaiella sp. KBW10 TaxID=2153357 RepID=UPI000F5B49B3|nr:CDP-alcohol phosphatidyltransferase family protein [Taibaiella sp. KBW10]RQO30509.1 CDP-alcohol phosphatidyltransferase [Taibaiella sp. KBW10]
MKHLPNILTLCNLVCGCLAITFILGAYPELKTVTGESFFPVLGAHKLVYGSLFIILAALFDVLDGLAARSLKAFSSIGKDLDSLADVVSFGVAPAMIIYQLLWMAFMSEPNALAVNPLVTLPAFLLPCFGALRLARFNQNNLAQSSYFSGMPIPAAGIMVALLPLVLTYDQGAIVTQLGGKWALYAIVVLLSYFMVSKIKFLKWKAPAKGIAAWWPHILITLTAVIGYFTLGYSALLLAFVVYIITSMLYKYPETKQFA